MDQPTFIENMIMLIAFCFTFIGVLVGACIIEDFVMRHRRRIKNWFRGK